MKKTTSERTHNPKFLAMYAWRTSWDTLYGPGDRRWNSYLWTEAFSVYNRGVMSKLPANTETLYTKVTCDKWATSVELILKPIGPKLKHGRSTMKHRVFVMCDRCDKLVPAGRIHQHTC